jgi:tetratricopeptide (TPR) repeat protein
MALLDEALQLGISLHRAGELTKARNIYEQILRQQPRHFRALHLSGVIASQTGNAQLAAQLIWHAIEVNPANAPAYCDLGSAFKQLNQLQAALASYDHAIALDADLADAHSNRGVVLGELQRLEEALASLDRAVALRPSFAAAYFNRANVLRALHRADAALDAYDRAIAIDPKYAEAHFNRGSLLLSAGRHHEALESFDVAISFRSNYAEARLNHGIALKALGRTQDALASLESAIAVDGRCAEAFSNRGVLQRELGQYAASLASFEQAIAIKPLYAEAHCNRGNTLTALNRFDEALACYDRAIELRHAYPEAHSSRGVALVETRRVDAAIASFDTAIELRPDYAEAYFNRAMASLMLGQFDTGWMDYEWRRKRPDVAWDPASTSFEEPAWRGDEPLFGRTILLWCEQGLGDTLQFCRYAPLLANWGATVILQAPPPLVDLLASLPQVRVVKFGDPLPRFDCQCPLMSLPLAFKTTLQTIPSPRGYLQSDPARVAQLRATLAKSDRPRIGLVWSGSRSHRNDRNRSIAVSLLLHFLPSGLQYISLQMDMRDIDRAVLDQRPDITDCADEIHDFRDTAALCESLDLLISVDTSVAHLSAAIGKETWVLLPFSPDWRWLLDRPDSPWYEALRLYRQDAIGDWTATLARLRQDLLQKFPSGTAPSDQRSPASARPADVQAAATTLLRH